MKLLTKSLSALLVASLSQYALCDIKFNGFSNIIAGKTQGGGSFLRYDDELSLDPNSSLGLQATSDLGGNLTAGLQILARGNKNWNAEVAWAYLKYQATDNLSFMAGRQRVPFYAYSDFINVGYTYNWINPSEIIYGSPFDTVNGVSALYSHYLGDMESTWQLTTGHAQSGPDDNFDFEYPDLVSLRWTGETGSLKTHFSVTKSSQSFGFGLDSFTDAIIAGATDAGITAEQAQDIQTRVLSDYTQDDNDYVQFFVVGGIYDNGHFSIASEFIRLQFEGSIVLSQKDSWYISFAKSFGDFTPHITYARDDIDAANTDYLNILNGTSLERQGQTIAAVANGFDRSQLQTLTLGLRWDFHESSAFKVDLIDFERTVTNTSGALLRFGVVTVF